MMMRRLQRKILLIPICFVLLRTPETVYRVLEYLHPPPAGGAGGAPKAAWLSGVGVAIGRHAAVAEADGSGARAMALGPGP